MAGDDLACVEPHSDRDRCPAAVDKLAVEPVDLPHHRPGRVQRSLGVVAHRVGRAEDDEHPVALELVDVSPMVQDHADHALEVVVQEQDELLGVHALGQRRESGDVGVQHRDFPPLAWKEAQCSAGAGEHVVGHLLVHVRLEQLAEKLRALVLASVVDGDGRQVRDRLQELLVLLLEDRGAERVVDVQRTDHVALGHQGDGDDRAEVLHDHRLLALEAVVQAGVGRDHRLAAVDDSFDHRLRAQELARVLGVGAAGHLDREAAIDLVDQDDEATRGPHQGDDAVHDLRQHRVEVERRAEVAG